MMDIKVADDYMILYSSELLNLMCLDCVKRLIKFVETWRLFLGMVIVNIMDEKRR